MQTEPRTENRRQKPHLWLIHLIGVMVPRRLRADWRQEWEAELRHREAMLADWHRLDWMSKLDLLRRSMGAFRDALWLQSYRWEDEMVQDVRFGVRMLVKNPGFTLAATLTLALGIGANAAIFQLLDAVRLRSLPVNAPHELTGVRIADMTGARGSFDTWHPSVTYRIWEQLRERQQAFSGIFAWGTDTLNLAPGGEVRPAQALWVSGDFFNVLGIGPHLGRLFTAADDQRGCGEAGVVISHSFWQREFGGDVNIIGREITLADRHFEIIGVTPSSFFGLEVGRAFDVALPICAEAIIRGKSSRLDSGTDWWLAVTGRRKNSYLSRVGPDYFKTLDTPLLAGRDFDERDTPTAPRVAIVNEAFARLMLNGASPVGQRFWIEATPNDPETLYEIVGLVRDTKYVELREEFVPIAFLAASQDPRSMPGGRFLIRSSMHQTEIAGAVKHALGEINPAISISFQGFEAMIESSILRERLLATLSGFFGLLALLLACIGLYGILSYAVASRTNEVGIRIALGAQSRQVLWLILREALLLVLIGMAAGMPLAVMTTRLASGLLFGLTSSDPFSLFVAGVLMFVVAVVAGYLPARRATRVDPVVALRCE